MSRLCWAGLLLVMAGGGCAPKMSDTSVPHVALAEATEDAVALQVEVIVAREMLRSYAGHRVVVDSLFAIAEQAPGTASGEVRPGFRTQVLQDSLADSQRTASSAVLHLSKPSIRDGVARITLTIDFPDPRLPAGRGYETVHYTLDTKGASWRIRTRVQLGIT
jgi:hypothetical protein